MKSFLAVTGSNATMTKRLQFARDHRSLAKRLSAYLEGDLATRTRARVDRHIAQCGECRRVLATLRLLLARLQQMPPPTDNPAPSEIAAAVRVRLDARGSS